MTSEPDARTLPRQNIDELPESPERRLELFTNRMHGILKRLRALKAEPRPRTDEEFSDSSNRTLDAIQALKDALKLLT